MTRAEAARALGVSRARLAAAERDGVANPDVDDRRVPDYGEAEVSRLRDLLAHERAEDARRRPPRRRGGASKSLAPSAPAAPRLTVGSEATRELVDRAEQLETAARVAEAERKLAVLRGEDAARLREVDELRLALAARAEAERAQAHREHSKQLRIAEILAWHHRQLVEAGFDEASIGYALSVAGAVLSAQHESALCGVYPYWLSHRVLCDAIGAIASEPPWVPILVPTEFGLVEGWRPLQPGD